TTPLSGDTASEREFLGRTNKKKKKENFLGEPRKRKKTKKKKILGRTRVILSSLTLREGEEGNVGSLVYNRNDELLKSGIVIRRLRNCPAR
ncbi:MAG: hypothetical protein ACK55Z_33545, partial [bacterium]